MITRYLLIVGGDVAERAAAAARGASIAGLDICELDEAVTLAGSAEPRQEMWPIIIGDVFASSHADAGGGKRTPAALLASYWGRYVALWREPDGRYSILRDPSGGLPCYYRYAGDMLLVGSDLEILEGAHAQHRYLDWQEIERILGARDLRGEATGIVGICELPAGSVLAIAPGKTVAASLWDPWQFAQRARPEGIDVLAGRLHATITEIVAALSRDRGPALALVSGGLDSSIVATALAQSGVDLTAMTLATSHPSGDERRYAAIIAEVTGAAYVERFFDIAHIELGRSQAAHLPRPVGRPFAQSMDRLLREYCAERGIESVFTGTGGDNVFCYLQSATPAADRLSTEGWKPASTTIADIARLSGATYAEVLRAGVKRALPWRRRYRWSRETRFLASTRASQPLATHPWLRAPPGARAGTSAHIAMILRSQNDTEGLPRGDGIDTIHPLLSQPVMECCLAIPTWRWCEGGVDRAVARRAFVNELPPAILRRRWKGGPDSFVDELVERHRGILRSRLLGGMLAERELLDRAAIAAVLNDPRRVSGGDAVRLLALSDAEAWVRGQYEG